MRIVRVRTAAVVMIVLTASLFCAQKAKLVYKNGTELECMIESYEIGKYAEIIDVNGNKRIVSWDSIHEIIFDKPAPEETVVQPVPAAVVPAPEPAAPGGGSMLDQFKKKKADPEVVSEPEPVPDDKQKHIEDIREENKYQKPKVDLDRKTGKVSLEYYKTLESDSKRRSWIENGGVLNGYGYTVNYTYTSMEFENMDTAFEMHGFGMTYSASLKWVRPPNYDEGKNTWSAFSLGAGGSFNVTFGSMEMDYLYWNGSYWVNTTTDMNMTMLAYEISGTVGYTFGLGRYLSPENWNGVMLGLFWKPNLVMSRSTTEIDGNYYEGDPQSSFNMTGFQWTIDFGSFGALADKLAKEAHLSINGFIIPETDETPFMLSIGLGIVWY